MIIWYFERRYLGYEIGLWKTIRQKFSKIFDLFTPALITGSIKGLSFCKSQIMSKMFIENYKAKI